MNDTRIARSSGALAVMGGSAWIAASVMHATEPRGCVRAECATLSMRDATTATALLVALAGLTLVVGGAGLLTLVKRRDGLSWSGRLGAALCGLGMVALALAVTVQELLYDGDFLWMPGFVVPGMLALTAGLALVGWTLLKSPVLPTWSGVALLASALLLLGANEQTSAVLLAIPFGLAWATTGATLLLRHPRAAAVPSAASESSG